MNDETLKEQIKLILTEYKIGFLVPPEMDTNKHLEDFIQAIVQLIAQAKTDELIPLLSNVPLNSLSYEYLITRLDNLNLRSKL